MKTNRKVLMKVRESFEKFLHAERFICSVILIIVTLITFVQVMMRFVFNAPFSWSEEVTLMFLVWFGYLCMPIDIYTDDHAALYFLYNKLPPAVRKTADLFRHGLLAWFFAEMIKYGWMITKLNLPKPQPATRFSQGWLYAPLIVGGILMLLYSVVNFVTVVLKPTSEYRRESDKEKTIEDLTVERGGTV